MLGSAHVVDPKHDSVEDLMQRFKESFRTPNTTMDMSHFQHSTHSSSTGRKRGPTHTRGHPPSPLNKINLTLITIITCVVAAVFATQNPCTLSVKVTLHVPEHFVADGSSFVVSMGSFLDVSNWLNPAQLILYYQTNSSTHPWPYTNLEKGYDLVTGEQAPEKIFR
ncbi:hypothetical protein CRUP_001536 [Coryphaenoides rupestris]|nr:hypothetical protein CRUP_001536 [Coryphaenoides rupestris]